jgi:hypothetical protein
VLDTVTHMTTEKSLDALTNGYVAQARRLLHQAERCLPTFGYNKIRAQCDARTAAAMSGQVDPFLAIKLVVSVIDEELAAYEHRPM